MTRRALICTAGPGLSPATPPGVDPLRLSTDAPGVAVETDTLLRRVALAQHSGADAIVFWDGDLLGRPDALEVLRAATSGADVEVFTAGGVLRGDDALATLRDAGLRRVTVPLCAAAAEAHDYITGTEGSFQRAVRGLRAARAAGLATRLLVPVLRPSHRGLDELVRRSLAIGVGGFVFMLPRGPDREAQPLLPTHPALVADSVVRALGVARAARRPAVTLGFEAALLGEFSRAVWPPAADMRVLGLRDAHNSSATPADSGGATPAEAAQPPQTVDGGDAGDVPFERLGTSFLRLFASSG